MTRAICSGEGCERPVHSHGLCNSHNARLRRTGSAFAHRPFRAGLLTREERFWPKVDRSGGPDACWPWLAQRQLGGYGAFRADRGAAMVGAHRYAYELVVGPIPTGLELDHLCRNPPCVNPAHLEPVTHQVNLLRGQSPAAIAARKTHCPKGHPYAGDNLKITTQGSRECRTCRVAWDQAR